MNQDVMNAALVALMPFLVSAAVALFHRMYAKLPANKQAQAQAIATVVVPAVEQMWKNAPGSGVQKKAEALKLASAMLSDLGLKITPDTLNVYVEAAVRALPAKDVESPILPGA